MTDRDHLARQWATNFRNDVTASTHEQTTAAIDLVMEKTEYLTRGAVEDRPESSRLDLRFAAVGDAHAHVQLPHTANSRDAGLDLFVNQPVTIEPGQFVDVSCGVGVELPEDSWALLTGRSSTFRKHKLLVINGIIDQGYRGELFAGVVNLGDEPVEVEAGWRLAQLIVIPKYADFNPVMVDELAEGERGTRGFGSSGV